MSERRVGPYRILGPLGRGGMGEVLLAEDTRLGRKVALKILPDRLANEPEQKERILREARAIAALSHPNIVGIHDLLEEDGRVHLVLEYVEGRSLSRVIREEGALAPARAARIGWQVAEALAASHALGILHRDVKSDNVLVGTDDRTKVLDFGLAKGVSTDGGPLPSGPDGGLTESGVILGSFPYMSPEQVMGEELDPRTDVFSFGVILFEMLTGRRPFAGETTPETALAILYSEPGKKTDDAVAPTLDPILAPVIARCLAKSRGDRWADGRELATAMAAAVEEFSAGSSSAALRRRPHAPGESPTVASAPPIRPRGRSTLVLRVRPRKVALIAGVVAAILLGIFGLLLFRSRDTGPAAGAGGRIAILPFTNTRPDPATDYLGPALADGVATRLASVRSLSVRPSLYASRFGGASATDPDAVARELAVDYLVTGRFLAEKDRVQITFELARIVGRKTILARTLVVPADEMLGFTDRVAEEIVRGLALALSPDDVARMTRNRPHDPEAYDLYLRSLGYSEEPSQSATALDLLRRSLERENDFAPAWAELSRRYNERMINHFGTVDDRDEAMAAARKAIELDPRLSVARALLGNHLVDSGKVEEATELLRQGIHDDPRIADLHHFLSYTYRFAGCLEESMAELDLADRVDPLRNKWSVTIRNPLLYLGRPADFLASLPVGTTPIRLFYRGFAFFHLGQTAQATAAFGEATRLEPANQFSRLGEALAHDIAGRDAEALAVVRDIVRRRRENQVWDGEVTYKLAQLAALGGDLELAESLFAQSVSMGFFCWPYFLTDPLLAPLRDAGRGKETFEAARLRHEAFRAKFFPAAKDGAPR